MRRTSSFNRGLSMFAFRASVLCLAFFASAPAFVGNAAAGTASSLPTNECAIIPDKSGDPVCGVNVPVPAITDNSTYYGARSDVGQNAFKPIDMLYDQITGERRCRYVDNYSQNPIFVPFYEKNGPAEWKGFVDNSETSNPGLKLTHCARPMDWPIPPSIYCLNPKPSIIASYPLDYTRTGAPPITATVTYACKTSAAAACTGDIANWQETATQQVVAGDSDAKNPDGTPKPDWTAFDNKPPTYAESSITYTSNENNDPTLCAAGVCGPSNGMVTAVMPTSGLCNAGTASAVMGSGPWSWTCQGASGGVSATCLASPGNPVCGPDNGQTFSALLPTDPNLCSIGKSGNFTGSGPWTWTCSPAAGAAVPVKCAAKPQETAGPKNAAHAYYYLLPLLGNGGIGTTELITKDALISNLDLYSFNIDVNHQSGASWLYAFFPNSAELAAAPPSLIKSWQQTQNGFPPNPAWWGLCYDAIFSAPVSGYYKFTTTVDDGSALWMDGSVLYDDEYGTITVGALSTDVGKSTWAPASHNVYLQAGTHRVMIKYYESYPLMEGLQYFVQYPGSPVTVLMPLTALPAGTTYSCPH